MNLRHLAGMLVVIYFLCIAIYTAEKHCTDCGYIKEGLGAPVDKSKN